MPDESRDISKPDEQAPDTDSATGRFARHPLRGRRDLWQLPLLVLSVALLAAGLWSWSGSAPPPEFDGALSDVRALLEAGEFEEAKAALDRIGEDLDHPAATDQHRRDFYLLAGDLVFLDQKAKGVSIDQINEQILDYYRQAETQYKADLDDARKVRRAETLIDLGRIDDAILVAQQLSPDAEDARHRLMRSVIEAKLVGAAETGDQRALQLLAEFRDDPAASLQDRLWAAARQAEIRLAGGYPDQAVAGLFPELHRLPRPDLPEAGELYLLLGRAYLDMGHVDEAAQRLRTAESLLSDGSALQGQVQVFLARVAQHNGELEDARDRFHEVTVRYEGTARVLSAWLGLAESEAELGQYEESLSAYAHLTSELRDGAQTLDVTVPIVKSSLVDRHRERFLRGDYQTALRYALMLENLYGNREPPADALLLIAETHRRIAEGLIANAEPLPDGSPDLAALDPVTLEEARASFFDAGEYYRRHAKQVLLVDAEGSAESLWNAGDSFDKAGDLEMATRAFTQYVQGGNDDPQRVEAKFRLAQIHQAAGDYNAAIDLFSNLIREHEGSIAAYRSYVPLAQCFLLRPEGSDPQSAERWLREVLNGEHFQPDAPEFRQALIELGQLYRRQGQYTEAIERLKEALDRYPDLHERNEFLFRLADSYRLSATEIGERLRGAMPQTERDLLERLRAERLEAALALYQDVRAQLEAKDPRRRTGLEDVLLRNAMFFRGDCAFDLGRHEQAIKFYDAAAQRYPDDPSSLVAMVQIVNAYAAQGKWNEAQTANERAKARLEEMPDEVWRRDDLPMTREHWERWLDSRELIQSKVASANAPGSA